MSDRTNEIQVIPVEWDSYGRPRRYEVVRPVATDQLVIDDNPIQTPNPGQMRQATSHIEGTWSDRARAFNLTTLNLSLVTGGLFLVASVALAGEVLPLLTLALVFLGGFSLTWLVAFITHTLISAEGAAFYETWRLWNFLDREQRERHRRYKTPLDRFERVFVPLAWFLALVGLVGWLVGK